MWQGGGVTAAATAALQILELCTLFVSTQNVGEMEREPTSMIPKVRLLYILRIYEVYITPRAVEYGNKINIKAMTKHMSFA